MWSHDSLGGSPVERNAGSPERSPRLRVEHERIGRLPSVVQMVANQIAADAYDCPYSSARDVADCANLVDGRVLVQLDDVQSSLANGRCDGRRTRSPEYPDSLEFPSGFRAVQHLARPRWVEVAGPSRENDPQVSRAQCGGSSCVGRAREPAELDVTALVGAAARG